MRRPETGFRPSVFQLLRLFARTAARRIANRFLFAWQKKAEARRKKRGQPEPDRTATGHRHQRFRMGSVLAVVFMAYLMLVIVMAMDLSFRKTMTGVIDRLEPVPPPATAEQLADFGQRLTHPVEAMQEETRQTAGRVTALLMLMAGTGTLLFAIGTQARQLSRPEPALAWLFEFPVPRPVLFASRLTESLFDGSSLPLLSMVPGIWLAHQGHGFWSSVGGGLAFGILLALTVAALRLSVEVFLLQKCPRRRRGTIAGFCAALGTLLMVAVLYGGGTPALTTALIAAAGSLPDWFFWNPLSAGFGAVSTPSVGQWLGAAGMAGLVCAAGVQFCSRLTAFGLEPGLETARGSTPSAAPAPGGSLRFAGPAGKELLMLVRQRTVLVQVLVAPAVMVVMMYFQTGGRLAEHLTGGTGALAAAIYGVCAYMVLIASQVAMNTELRTLWLLLSLPQPLSVSLRMKGRIWGAAVAGLAVILTGIAIGVRPESAGGLLLRLPFIMIFVALVADLSIGIRTMGSSVLSETTVHFRQWAAWLPLFLSAAAGHVVFSGDLYLMAVQILLLGALDFSVWQKLNAELPWLTEPAEDPPPRLYLMHGLLSACGCFALFGLGLLLAPALKVPPPVLHLAAGPVAAGIVALLAFAFLHRGKVRVFPDTKPGSAGAALLFTIGAAVIVAGAVALWKFLSGAPPPVFSPENVSLLTGGDDPVRRVLLLVLNLGVAPLAMEYVFRGLVYRGLRQNFAVLPSVFWSTLFFAAVQPASSAAASLIPGAVNAFLTERTGRLLPAAIVHAVWLACLCY